MPEEKALGLIGLARRARKITAGFPAVEKEIKCGRARIALLDAGAGANVKEKLEKMCRASNVPLKYISCGELERILGDYRICAALSDENFSSQILKYID